VKKRFIITQAVISLAVLVIFFLTWKLSGRYATANKVVAGVAIGSICLVAFSVRSFSQTVLAFIVATATAVPATLPQVLLADDDLAIVAGFILALCIVLGSEQIRLKRAYMAAALLTQSAVMCGIIMGAELGVSWQTLFPPTVTAIFAAGTILIPLLIRTMRRRRLEKELCELERNSIKVRTNPSLYRSMPAGLDKLTLRIAEVRAHLTELKAR